MIDYLELGPVPADENCEQLGPNYDPAKATRECRAYVNQLRRQFPDPPFGADFVIKTFSHEFGSYKEVCVRFSDISDEAVDFAYRVEDEAPANWDDEARRELNI
jgi:hypothetical protein